MTIVNWSRPTCDLGGPTLDLLIGLKHQIARLNWGEISGNDHIRHVEKQVELKKDQIELAAYVAMIKINMDDERCIYRYMYTRAYTCIAQSVQFILKDPVSPSLTQPLSCFQDSCSQF